MSSKEFTEATRRLDKFIPYESWQGGETGQTARLMRSNASLNYRQRLHMMIFLAGNGVSHADINTLLSHRMRDRSAKMHLKSTLNAISLGAHPDKWHFFNVHLQMKTYLKHPTRAVDGDAYYTRQKLVNGWDAFCQHHLRTTGSYPTMALQQLFLSSTEVERAAFVVN